MSEWVKKEESERERERERDREMILNYGCQGNGNLGNSN